MLGWCSVLPSEVFLSVLSSQRHPKLHSMVGLLVLHQRCYFRRIYLTIWHCRMRRAPLALSENRCSSILDKRRILFLQYRILPAVSSKNAFFFKPRDSNISFSYLTAPSTVCRPSFPDSNAVLKSCLCDSILSPRVRIDEAQGRWWYQVSSAKLSVDWQLWCYSHPPPLLPGSVDYRNQIRHSSKTGFPHCISSPFILPSQRRDCKRGKGDKLSSCPFGMWGIPAGEN